MLTSLNKPWFSFVKTFCKSLLLVSFALVCISCAKCSASTITMTTDDWNSYNKNFATLVQLNNQSQQELTLLKTDLTELMKFNEILKLEVSALRRESQELKKISESQKISLENVNKSMTEHSKEQKRKQLILAMQRDIYCGVAVICVIGLIAKN